MRPVCQDGLMELQIPSLTDVFDAQRQIRPYLRPTPLYQYPALDALVGTEVWVKHENHQPVGAFKVRGGINLISRLSDEERRRGVIAASTGNHGQSVAYAAHLFKVPAIICVPQGANPVKVASMRGLGAQVIEHGADFDAAREYCEHLAAERGYRYIHSGNEPLLIAGVATYALEILEEQPGIDTIIVAIGGGSGAAGICVAAKAIKPEIEVLGVQSEAAPAAERSWRAHELLEGEMGTFAEGIATRSAFELPQRILWERLDDFLLVSDSEIRQALVWMLETTRNLVEAAGAAPLAGALRIRDRLQGKRIALVCSGGNISPQQLLEVLQGAVL